MNKPPIKMPTARDLYPLGPETKPINWIAIGAAAVIVVMIALQMWI